jgi:L-alanine-DL-glutamate epimerase-like enolase superfamily enzyme
VPCYDTTLLIDDLHLPTDEEGAALIASEARFGFEQGHRAFKIKVGRGARHMPLEAGNRRDIAVIRAVRAAVGADAKILIDANNGYTLNIAKHILSETADCNLFWLEEAFHEDDELYEELHAWIEREGLPVLIADGEGPASPHLLDYARRGIIDVIQYDIFGYGLTKWLETGPTLDEWNVRTAPHHYGRHLGNFVSGHLASAVANFAFIEWDELSTPGLDSSAYSLNDGLVTLPQAPGFGLKLDEKLFRQAVQNNGFTVRSS